MYSNNAGVFQQRWCIPTTLVYSNHAGVFLSAFSFLIQLSSIFVHSFQYSSLFAPPPPSLPPSLPLSLSLSVQVADDFSNYQLSRLLNRSRTSKKLESVRTALKSSEAAIVNLGEEGQVHEVESQRIASSDSAHYILVRGADIDSVSSSQTDEESADGRHDDSSTASEQGGSLTKTRCREVGVSPLVMETASSRPSGSRIIDEDAGNLPGEGKMLAPDYFVLSSDSEGEEGVKIEEQLAILQDIQATQKLPQATLVGGTELAVLESDGSESDSDSEVGKLAGLSSSLQQPNSLPPFLPATSGNEATIDLSQSVAIGKTSLITSGDHSSCGLPQSPPPAAKEGGVSPDSLTITETDVALRADTIMAQNTAENNSSSCEPLGGPAAAGGRDSGGVTFQASSLEKGRSLNEEGVAGSSGIHDVKGGFGMKKELLVSEDVREQEEMVPMSSMEQESGDVIVNEDKELDRRGLEEAELIRRDVEEFAALVEEGVGAAQEKLREDVLRLDRQRTQQSRAATAVSNTMYKEAQVTIKKLR